MKLAGQYWVPDHEELQLSQLEAGGWQLDHLAAALAHVTNWTRAIDGGAHVGSWTLAMAERFGVVIAFEPAPDTYACLDRNVCYWREKNPNHPAKISLRREAIGAEIGHAGMADDTKYHGGNTGGRYLTSGHDVLIRPIDQLMLPELGFLKLDVEGYELFALQGAQRTITRCRPVVMIEDKPRMAHRYGYAPHAAGAFLEGLGMVLVGGVGADKVYGWPT